MRFGKLIWAPTFIIKRRDLGVQPISPASEAPDSARQSPLYFRRASWPEVPVRRHEADSYRRLRPGEAPAFARGRYKS